MGGTVLAGVYLPFDLKRCTPVASMALPMLLPNELCWIRAVVKVAPGGWCPYWSELSLLARGGEALNGVLPS